MVRIKRAYQPAASRDGVRVLVDRLWPRGITKEKARISKWMPELGPSDALRKFFGHDPARWEEFHRRYRKELARAHARKMLDELAAVSARGTLTLVYGARDEQHNQAVVIKEVLDELD
jgi:uncharacterized protein YeaO (DUF488 family)